CLGDTARAPRFIETVPRVGYRFLAPVKHMTSPPLRVAERRLHGTPRGRWLGAALAALWLATHGGGRPLAAQPPHEDPPASVQAAYLHGIDLSRRDPSQWSQAARW